MQRHPEIGDEIIQRVAGLEEAARAVRHHHERWDGSGYPDGLRARTIPIEARIVAAADAYSAMTSDAHLPAGRSTAPTRCASSSASPGRSSTPWSCPRWCGC